MYLVEVTWKTILFYFFEIHIDDYQFLMEISIKMVAKVDTFAVWHWIDHYCDIGDFFSMQGFLHFWFIDIHHEKIALS